jgi:hypothetical protein
LAVEGQIQGGFVQGLGYALWEELIRDTGRLSNPNMMDYKIPGTLDVPLAIEPIIVEEREASGPFAPRGSANRGSSPWLRRSRMPLQRRLEFAFGNCRSRPSACLVRLRVAALMKSRSEVTGEDSNVAEIDAP